VSSTDPVPSSHRFHRVVRVAGTQEVGDHKPFEGESSGQGAAADGDDGLRSVRIVDEAIIGGAVVDLHHDALEDLLRHRPEFRPSGDELTAAKRGSVVDVGIDSVPEYYIVISHFVDDLVN